MPVNALIAAGVQATVAERRAAALAFAGTPNESGSELTQ
jgi:hypothetical protein